MWRISQNIHDYTSACNVLKLYSHTHTPLPIQGGCDTMSIFKQNKVDLNSEFSFS